MFKHRHSCGKTHGLTNSIGRSTSPIKHSHKIGKPLFLDTSILHNCWLYNILFYAYKISLKIPINFPFVMPICDVHQIPTEFSVSS